MIETDVKSSPGQGAVIFAATVDICRQGRLSTRTRKSANSKQAHYGCHQNYSIRYWDQNV